MQIEEDAWLARILGRPAYRVYPPTPDVAVHAADHKCAFYYAKIDLSDTASVRQLSEAGFYVVDVCVTHAVRASDPSVANAVAADTPVGPVRPDEHVAVLEIAGSCFQYSRFHLDPMIPKSIAHRIKREWIGSYTNGSRGDLLFVARPEGRAAGFLASLITQNGQSRTAVIDLIGVSPSFQRRGIASMLVNHFFAHYRSSCDILQVGTQGANLPSLKLYAGLGFKISNMTYVMHKHVR